MYYASRQLPDAVDLIAADPFAVLQEVAVASQQFFHGVAGDAASGWIGIDDGVVRLAGIGDDNAIAGGFDCTVRCRRYANRFTR